MNLKRVLLACTLAPLLLVFFLCSSNSIAAAANTPRNLLNMVEGTVLISSSTEYSDGKWTAFNIFDGNPKSGWSSSSNQALGATFLLELPQQYRLEKILTDNTENQESAYPGISAKDIEIWGSTESAENGFKKLTTLHAPNHGRASYLLPANSEARWLKIVISSNWGNKEYSELMEMEAYGTPVGPPPAQKSFSGVFLTNYGPVKLAQNGNVVSGCYPHSIGTLQGACDGRALRFDWQQKGNSSSGTALMAMSSDGVILNGVWYKNGELCGEWLGHRNDNAQCDCEAGSTNGGIAGRLGTSHRAVLYGIHFETDSDKLKADSDQTLAELLSVLKQQTQLHLEVEGHTDSTNTEEYNMSLSQRRAQSVVNWLKAHEISGARISAKGYGKSRPVADNNTPQGRALNRRVEISLVN